MPVDIRELQAEDFDAVAALWAEHGQHGGGRQVTTDTLRHLTQRYPGLALVAMGDHAVTGTVLVDDACGSDNLTLLLLLDGNVEPDGPLADELLDRALGKAASQGIRKCHVRLGNSQDARPFWERSRWTDWPQLGRPSSARQSAHAMTQRLMREQPIAGTVADAAA
jgi:hypothetical protein